MGIRVLALDLERTLISDAMNREPRPGLSAFLHFCIAQFERVALFTSVSRPHAEAVIADLHGQGAVPKAFVEKLEYVEWEGRYKDLRSIPNVAIEEVLLVDDDPAWVVPGQESQYIPIAEYDPYLVRGTDTELQRVRRVLEERCRMPRP